MVLTDTMTATPGFKLGVNADTFTTVIGEFDNPSTTLAAWLSTAKCLPPCKYRGGRRAQVALVQWLKHCAGWCTVNMLDGSGHAARPTSSAEPWLASWTRRLQSAC